MEKKITQRELRNASGAVMRALDEGQSFIVTRNGVPVAELRPIRDRTLTSKGEALAAFAHAPKLDLKKFRADVDAILDQDPTPRG